MIDKGPQLIDGSSDSLMDTIAYYMEKEKINQLRVEYNLFVNKSGKIDRMSIEESNDPIVDSIVIASVKDWRFEAGIKSGKNVNSIFPIKLHARVTDSLKPINENDYFVAVENMPEVIGGLYSIQSKIKYPEIAKRAGIEGNVYVQAFIDENGNVANAKIIKGIGSGCDEAALDAVKQTKFKPGRQKGKPVKVQVSIPIAFKLQ
ncbi:MAG: energy transducer TonB [Ignavibacteriaceae bacterium]|nr:energy transducer TonB [Ignavibacteriaceae bacterium]